jgi:hypothetical protein
MAFNFNPDPSAPVENIGEMRAFTRDYIDVFRHQNPHLYECDWSDYHLTPMKAYENCSVLKTVVNRNAQAMSLGKWYILNKSDMTGDDIIHQYPKLGLLLQNPNPYQVFPEFIAQCEVYRQVFGSCWIYASTPIGTRNDRATGLWVLPPSVVHIHHNLNNVAYVKLTLNHREIEVPISSLMEIKDSGNEVVAFGRGHDYAWQNERRGRIHAARFAINNIMIAEQSMYEINRDRGALGAWVADGSNEGTRTAMTPREEDALLEKFRGFFGMNRNKHKQMVINRPLKWVPMSMNVRDLMLIEGMDQSVQTICNAFDYPKEMLISDARYSNRQAAKGFYDESVIPFSLIYAAKLKELLLPSDAYFVIDFSHLPAMKEAEEQLAKVYLQKSTAVQKLYEDGIISREEARLELGYEESIEGKTMYNANIENNGGTNTGANQGS